ncbi:Choline kinase alpha [Halotydeus destructor]|nr:Choline kinase alpha [Halotydeus destructor]
MGDETKPAVRRLSQMWNHDDAISKEDARKLCANFLSGSWDTLTDDTFDIQVLPLGLVNRIFICENKSGNDDFPDEPRKVILRLYGGKMDVGEGHIFRNGGILEEVLVFYTMGNLGLGPKLYGVFPEGRLEQYIPSRISNNADYECLETQALFARKLARMHVCKLPLNLHSKTWFDKVEMMMPMYLSTHKEQLLAKASDRLKQMLLDTDEQAEYDWLKDTFLKIKTRRVLSHGDLNRANVLIADKYDDPDDRLVLIDYEFTSYSCRGIDIGLHFLQRTVDVTQLHNNFKSGLEYPSIEERKHFIRAYNDEIRRSGAYDLDESENGLDNVDEMLIEAEFFVLMFSLFSRFLMTHDIDKFAAIGFDLMAWMEDHGDKYDQQKASLCEALKGKAFK